MTPRGNSITRTHGVPRMFAGAPICISPFAARNSRAPVLVRSTCGAGTMPARSVHTAPDWLPMSTVAPLPTIPFTTVEDAPA
jgi:hypothetical protein